MDHLKGIVQTGPRAYKGFRIIRIETIPPALSGFVVRDVLSRCIHENVSAEVCLITGAEATGDLSVFLILRTGGVYPYEVADRLDHTSRMILQILTRWNTGASPVQNPSLELKRINRFFGGDLSTVSTGKGYFPAETYSGTPKVYVPGSYSECSASPIDWSRLAQILCCYPYSWLGICLNPSALTPKELFFVQRNRQWFESRPHSEMRQKGSIAFSRLGQMSEKRPFFVNFYSIGNEAFVRDIASQIAVSGFSSFPLPWNFLRNSGYLTWGDEWFSGITSVFGHESETSGRLSALMRRLTHLAYAEEIARAFSFPSREEDIVGIRISPKRITAEPLPVSLRDSQGIYLGEVSENNGSSQSVFIRPENLARHGFFVGKPGSGKTVFALGLLYRLWKHENHYPFIAVEMTKREYRGLLDVIPDLKVYTPGRMDISPIQLNPFLPPRGIRLEEYEQQLNSIFQMAISMTHPLDIIFPQVISRCYARYGWRPDSTRDDEGVQRFGMHEFIREFKEYTREKYGSDPEALHNIENGGTVRLMALMNNPLFDTDQSIEINDLLDGHIVIELDALSNQDQKSLVAGMLLSQMMMVIKQRHVSDAKLKNVILIDEAHLLLSQQHTYQEGSANPQSAAISLLQEMTLTLRSYGIAMLFGDQSPSRLTRVIMDNVNLKMMFRIDSQQDRSILEDTALLSREMSTEIVSLSAGEGYFLCDAMKRPTRIKVPNAEAFLKINKGMPDDQVRQRAPKGLKPPFGQCGRYSACQHCDLTLRANARFISLRLCDSRKIRDILENPNDQSGIAEYLEKELRERTIEVARQFHVQISEEDRLLKCVKVQLIRQLLLQDSCMLSEEELIKVKSAEGREEPTQSDTSGDAVTERPSILELLQIEPGTENPGT